jgi:SAM-dependent methyltransferase
MSETSDYWDKIYFNVVPSNITDNFEKKRILLKYIFDYVKKNDAIVEIGCGKGLIGGILHLVYAKLKWTGIDISPEAIKFCRNVWKIDGKIADATNVPLPDNCCNVLMALDVLEHIHPKDRIKTYSEINRLLKDKGMVFLSFSLDPTNGHNAKYDFGFTNKDLFELVGAIHGIIYKIEKFNTINRNYQFFILLKDTEYDGVIAVDPK